MKKLFLIIPLFLFACNNSTDNTVEQADTVVVKVDSAALRSAAAPITQSLKDLNVVLFSAAKYAEKSSSRNFDPASVYLFGVNYKKQLAPFKEQLEHLLEEIQENQTYPLPVEKIIRDDEMANAYYTMDTTTGKFLAIFGDYYATPDLIKDTRKFATFQTWWINTVNQFMTDHNLTPLQKDNEDSENIAKIHVQIP